MMDKTGSRRLIAQPAIESFRVKAEAVRRILLESPELQLVRYMKFQL